MRRVRQRLETHLDVDLDRDRDALLQLLCFLIEVLAELPDGDSSLDEKRKREGENDKKNFKIHEKS